MSDRQEAMIGDVMSYKLAPSDLPIVPDKIWHGRVMEVHRNRADRVISYVVHSIELPETEGERVSPFQVVSVEPARGERS